MLFYNGKKLIFKEVLIPCNSVVSVSLANHKDITKKILEKNKIPTPRGRNFNNIEEATAIKYGKKLGYPLVVKANRGTHGTNVRVDIRNEKDLKKAVDEIMSTPHRIMVEETIIGNDFRILVLENKVLGVIKRIPANVVGDGVSSIYELVKKKNKDPMRGEGHSKSLCKIKINDEVLKVLSSQGMKTDSVIEKGKKIFLRRNANISIDATDDLHPEVTKIAIKATKAIGLKLGAVDYITKDIKKSPKESGGAIIEINANPMITIHEKPFQGKSRIVSKKIVKYCFNIK
jgi:cyanophycin synthetase